MSMDLKTFEFPRLTPVDCLLYVQQIDPKLLAEAKARGFYNGNTPYNRLFSTLFFSGGKLNFKNDLPEGFRTSATLYLKAIMGSFEPKHEEKEAVCAMLLSELVEDGDEAP